MDKNKETTTMKDETLENALLSLKRKLVQRAQSITPILSKTEHDDTNIK